MGSRITLIISYVMMVIGVFMTLGGLFALAVTFFMSLIGWGFFIIGVMVAFYGSTLRGKASAMREKELVKQEPQ